MINNFANLPQIAYRIGDYGSFRHRLLQPLPSETALSAWQPSAEGDLALQLIEWWAYLGDILTFYNERIANEAYLQTATLPASVNHLVQLLGYRPRPALGASVQLAALLSPGALVPLTIPAGLQVQSKPGPGQQPQVFELDSDTKVGTPDAISTIVVPGTAPLTDNARLWLAGTITGIKTGDRMLLVNEQAVIAQRMADYQWIKVNNIAAQTDPLGNTVTELSFTTIAGKIAGDAQAKDYVLLRPMQAAQPWPYGSTNPNLPVIGVNSLDLANTARDLTGGSLLLLDVSDGVAVRGIIPTLVLVASYAERVWYANGVGGDPTVAPQPPVPPIAVPHANITFSPLLNGSWSSHAASVTARWSWSTVGKLVPVLTAEDLAYKGGNTALIPANGAPAFPAPPDAVMLADAAGNAAIGTIAAAPATAPNGAVVLSRYSPLPPTGLVSPLQAYFNLLSFSRGKTVASEVLGSGNPTVAGQDFPLLNAPVTYFADPSSISGNGFSSTVRVSVDGIEWQEVSSFYGQPATAQVFVLREDDQGVTHVTFGDGVNGALLPTGTNNVVATYRYGSGAITPAARTLTVLQTPTPGLKAISNPVPPTGGADADSPDRLRKLAPASVLTFDRAVSLDDYQAIAATAAGVRQALAQFRFDPVSQRPVVVLWIAGDAGAVAQATLALAGIAIPNHGLRIKQATAITATLSLTYVRDERFDNEIVRSQLTGALVDPDAGLFGTNVIGIGQPIYASQIAAACLAVEGVTAIRDTNLAPTDPGSPFVVRPSNSRLRRFGQALLEPACTGYRFDPGAGSYFSVPNDEKHVILTGTTAS